MECEVPHATYFLDDIVDVFHLHCIFNDSRQYQSDSETGKENKGRTCALLNAEVKLFRFPGSLYSVFYFRRKNTFMVGLELSPFRQAP